MEAKAKFNSKRELMEALNPQYFDLTKGRIPAPVPHTIIVAGEYKDKKGGAIKWGQKTRKNDALVEAGGRVGIRYYRTSFVQAGGLHKIQLPNGKEVTAMGGSKKPVAENTRIDITPRRFDFVDYQVRQIVDAMKRRDELESEKEKENVKVKMQIEGQNMEFPIPVIGENQNEWPTMELPVPYLGSNVFFTVPAHHTKYVDRDDGYKLKWFSGVRVNRDTGEYQKNVKNEITVIQTFADMDDLDSLIRIATRAYDSIPKSWFVENQENLVQQTDEPVSGDTKSGGAPTPPKKTAEPDNEGTGDADDVDDDDLMNP